MAGQVQIYINNKEPQAQIFTQKLHEILERSSHNYYFRGEL